MAALATTDPLTQILNRRGFIDQANLSLSQAHREGSPVCLMMCDLDHFKKINDKFGHPAGDKALREFGGCLSQLSRKHDVTGRIGGEEFAMLLIGSNLSQGSTVAERLLSVIRNLNITEPHSRASFSMTLSIGVVEVDRTLEEAWQKADKALYKAKTCGRDRVICEHQLSDLQMSG